MNNEKYEKVGELLVEVLVELDKLNLMLCTNLNISRGDCLFHSRVVARNAVKKACDVLGLDVEDWDRILDADRPVEEWKLIENKDPLSPEEKILKEIFGPQDGKLVLRGGGWTICPFYHGDGFAITPPVVPQPENKKG